MVYYGTYYDKPWKIPWFAIIYHIPRTMGILWSTMVHIIYQSLPWYMRTRDLLHTRRRFCKSRHRGACLDLLKKPPGLKQILSPHSKNYSSIHDKPQVNVTLGVLQRNICSSEVICKLY